MLRLNSIALSAILISFVINLTSCLELQCPQKHFYLIDQCPSHADNPFSNPSFIVQSIKPASSQHPLSFKSYESPETHRPSPASQSTAITTETPLQNTKPTIRSTGPDQTNPSRPPLVSFEDWQRQLLQSEDERPHKKKSGSHTGREKQLGQQMIDSIDGGLEGDLGAMFEGLIGITPKPAPNNVYEEGAYIEPKKSAPSPSPQSSTDKKVPRPFKPLPVKALKERFNYASTDCAATVRSANKEAKGANSILYESKDQYLLNKCSANKFVIINLCESILVDTIVLANFEFFSSTFKDFRVYVADRYPTKDWKLLGQWQARNTRDLQVFKVQDRAGWSEYMKIEFLTHYGHEYYCPLSLVRVHGMPMMEYFNIVERKGLSGDGDEDVFLDDESLWPSEVRDEIIQPKRDVTNTSEYIPVATEAEEELAIVIPPVIVETVTSYSKETPSSESSSLEEIASHSLQATETHQYDPPTTTAYGPVDTNLADSSSTNPTKDNGQIKTPDIINSVDTVDKDDPNTCEPPSNVGVDQLNSQLFEQDDIDSSLTPSSDSQGIFTAMVEEHTAKPIITTSLATTSATVTASSTGTEESRSGASTKLSFGSHGKESNIQESIYKTIMKRLNILELNATLSQRYLDEQNKMLNTVFVEMEKRHQDQLILLLGRLNDTASLRLDNMKRRYEERYEELKSQSQRDAREMTVRLNMLSDQITFEKRMSTVQLVCLVGFFIYTALSRGTFSSLSPVMQAQAEERKRRSSAENMLSTGLKHEKEKTSVNTSKSVDATSFQSKGSEIHPLSDAIVPTSIDTRKELPLLNKKPSILFNGNGPISLPEIPPFQPNGNQSKDDKSNPEEFSHTPATTPIPAIAPTDLSTQHREHPKLSPESNPSLPLESSCERVSTRKSVQEQQGSPVNDVSLKHSSNGTEKTSLDTLLNKN
ncbi:UNC-like C-terminal-domain-containing protein [Phycomyces nitens]|nr:UNC-like C-terminal-domain-containing protein [Phycomyces nitens]